MGYLDPTNDFRWILPGETDANSPLSEELMSQIRNNIEASVMDTKASGFRFNVVETSATPGSTLAINEIEVEKVAPGDPDWLVDQFADLLVTFGEPSLAIGNNFTIDTNSALTGAGTAIITAVAGTDFAGAGVNVGDTGYIFYVLTGTSHTHDGVDSAPLAVSTCLLSTEEETEFPVTASVATVYTGTLTKRQGMRGLKVFLGLRRVENSLGNPESWSNYGQVLITIETESSGSCYSIDDQGVKRTETNTLISETLTIPSSVWSGVVGNLDVAIEGPTLDIGTLGLETDAPIAIRVTVDPNGGVASYTGATTYVRVYSDY